MDKNIEIGFYACNVQNVSPKTAFELCKKDAVLFDVREAYLNTFKTPDVSNICCFPKSTLQENYKKLPKNKMLIFFDSAGLRSKEAVLFLKERGFENIFNMAGGIVEWERDNLPIITNINERLTGSCMCQLKPRERKKQS